MRRSTLLALLAIPGAVVAASFQPEPINRSQDKPTRRPIEGPLYAAWIPPGTYTAIVVNSSGDQRRWAISLMTKTSNVPIVVPPGDNVLIPFNGWTVKAEDEARLISNLVPFDDSALYNKAGDQPKYVLSAWGITATGPVQFVYRDVKDERRQLP